VQDQRDVTKRLLQIPGIANAKRQHCLGTTVDSERLSAAAKGTAGELSLAFGKLRPSLFGGPSISLCPTAAHRLHT